MCYKMFTGPGAGSRRGSTEAVRLYKS
ncbi:hypothetical protein M3J09_009500 [Ascochyta lentis]